jgi:hypothetical protein
MPLDPDTIAAVAGSDEHKRCFTYCGDDLCDCPAREAHSILGFIAPALPVLATMCGKAGLRGGAAKAEEMNFAVRNYLERQSDGQG